MIKYTYPRTIVRDRYHGTYSGGVYTAWNMDFWDVPQEIDGGDPECHYFWRYEFSQGYRINKLIQPVFAGFGDTPDEALKDLMTKIN